MFHFTSELPYLDASLIEFYPAHYSAEYQPFSISLFFIVSLGIDDHSTVANHLQTFQRISLFFIDIPQNKKKAILLLFELTTYPHLHMLPSRVK